MQSRLHRRAFVQTLSVLFMGLPGRSGRPGSEPDERARHLLTVFGDIESARTVGAEYLRSAPHEADLPGLLAALCGPASGDACVAHADEWAAALAARCKDDFLEGRVVRIQGWVLSRTEARLCAVAALT